MYISTLSTLRTAHREGKYGIGLQLPATHSFILQLRIHETGGKKYQLS